MHLRHVHLRPALAHPHSSTPSAPAPLYTSYTRASRVQELLRREHLLYKTGRFGPAVPPPPPTLLSFTPQPTYTLGRRQTAPLAPAERARLQAPLAVRSSEAAVGADTLLLPVSAVSSPRGGLTTYHGPGQVVLWPVLDLRADGHRKFSVRCYTRLLEETTVSVLATVAALASGDGEGHANGMLLHGFTTADPGVWVASSSRSSSTSTTTAELRKIAAVGTHLRRHVTGLGTAINVDMPGTEGRRGVLSADVEAEEERRNPWARIVACGLEGKGITSVRAELGEDRWARLVAALRRQTAGHDLDASGRTVEELVAGLWARELAQRLGTRDGVRVIEGTTLDALLRELEERLAPYLEAEDDDEVR